MKYLLLLGFLVSCETEVKTIETFPDFLVYEEPVKQDNPCWELSLLSSNSLLFIEAYVDGEYIGNSLELGRRNVCGTHILFFTRETSQWALYKLEEGEWCFNDCEMVFLVKAR